MWYWVAPQIGQTMSAFGAVVLARRRVPSVFAKVVNEFIARKINMLFVLIERWQSDLCCNQQVSVGLAVR